MQQTYNGFLIMHKSYFLGIVGILLSPLLHAEIIDNTSLGFQTSGNWGSSSFTAGFYGVDYQYALAGVGNLSATWDFQVGADGIYTIEATWTSHTNRAPDAKYTIYNNGSVIGVVQEDQRQGGGLFNLLGTYTLAAGTLDVVLTDAASGVVVADAVRLTYVGPPGSTPPTGGITDNGDSAFSLVGNWGSSSFTTGFYGVDYRYALAGVGNLSATWDYQVGADGIYTIEATWTSHTNRAPDAKYTIYNNGSVVGVVQEDQRQGGGQFNLLGTYTLAAGTLDVVLTDAASGVVVADAVRLTYIGPVGSPGSTPPSAVIDSPAGDVTIETGEVLDFRGSGSDPDGNDQQLSYVWQFGAGSGIPDSTLADPGLVQFNNPGTYTVTFTVTDVDGYSTSTAVTVTVQSVLDGVVTDNGDSAFTLVGNWGSSSFTAGFYGVDYQYALAGVGNLSATWDFQVGADGIYTIEATWTSHTNRAPDAKYTIYNNGSVIGVVQEDQRQGGGQFNLLGTYTLAAGALDVVLTDAASGVVVADAVRLTYVGPPGSTPPTGVVRDNGDGDSSSQFFFRSTAFSWVGEWWRSTSASGFYGVDYRYVYPGVGNQSATWDFHVVADGTYTIEATWTSHTNRAPDAKYTIYNNGSVIGVVQEDQRQRGGQFNLFGTYTLAAGTLDVVLTDAASGIVVADAVRLTYLGPDPAVVIQEPSDLELTTNFEITADAIAYNLPTDWSVEFVLDGDTANPIVNIGNSISHPYTLSVKKEYTLDATIVDQNGVPQFNSDSVTFGVGDSYVAFGDSITAGFRDDIAFDNVSDDGRNASAGFEPILNNLLTAAKSYPHTVIDEGVGGATSSFGRSHIASVLSAQPNAKTILIQFGTNDSNEGLRSGVTLNPGQANYANSFKDNMQSIINAVLSKPGRVPVLAKVPPVLVAGSKGSAMNNLIIQYNQVIDELVLKNSLPVSGPDFFTHFQNHPEEYSDDLHPNGQGYISMATLWFNVLP